MMEVFVTGLFGRHVAAAAERFAFTGEVMASHPEMLQGTPAKNLDRTIDTLECLKNPVNKKMYVLSFPAAQLNV
jgi:hypothetical protein